MWVSVVLAKAPLYRIVGIPGSVVSQYRDYWPWNAPEHEFHMSLESLGLRKFHFTSYSLPL